MDTLEDLDLLTSYAIPNCRSMLEEVKRKFSENPDKNNEKKVLFWEKEMRKLEKENLKLQKQLRG